jgi:alkylhydroperoxidase family enzyme
MAWIRTIDWDDADAELDALYAQVGDRATGGLDNILKIHSLAPSGMRAHLALYRQAMSGTPGLPKADREMIAVAVSVANGCRY